MPPQGSEQNTLRILGAALQCCHQELELQSEEMSWLCIAAVVARYSTQPCSQTRNRRHFLRCGSNEDPEALLVPDTLWLDMRYRQTNWLILLQSRKSPHETAEDCIYNLKQLENLKNTHDLGASLEQCTSLYGLHNHGHGHVTASIALGFDKYIVRALLTRAMYHPEPTVLLR